MKEAQLVDKLQDAVTRLGIEDDVVAGGLIGGAVAGQRAAVELEGARLPGFHVGDVLDALRA